MRNNEPSKETIQRFDDLQIVIGSMMRKSEKSHLVSHYLLYGGMLMMFINVLTILFGILYITNSMPEKIGDTLIASMTGLELMIVE